MQLYRGAEEEEGRTALIVAENQGDAEEVFMDHFGIKNTGGPDDVGFVVYLIVDEDELKRRGCYEIND